MLSHTSERHLENTMVYMCLHQKPLFTLCYIHSVTPHNKWFEDTCWTLRSTTITSSQQDCVSVRPHESGLDVKHSPITWAGFLPEWFLFILRADLFAWCWTDSHRWQGVPVPRRPAVLHPVTLCARKTPRRHSWWRRWCSRRVEVTAVSLSLTHTPRTWTQRQTHTVRTDAHLKGDSPPPRQTDSAWKCNVS